jgi:hypothetical protein
MLGGFFNQILTLLFFTSSQNRRARRGVGRVEGGRETRYCFLECLAIKYEAMEKAEIEHIEE